MTWTIFILFVLFLLGLDLLVLHKKGEAVDNKKAAKETFFWVSIALLFSVAIYWIYKNGLIDNPNALSPKEAVYKYITGYLIELSLSVDNLFVMSMIFISFKIPLKYQHRALFWGILGAIVFRGIMIAVGITLIKSISWMTYVFGAFLLYTAFKMLFTKDEDENSSSFATRFNNFFKTTNRIHGEKFWIIENGKRVATPLFGALMMIELTDLLFALDSIPAILAITTDTFLVYSSNIFAILGLRSMYFFLANMLQKFHYLKYSVAAILIFVAIKLILLHYYTFPEWFSLLFIAVALSLGIVISLKKGK